MVSLLGYIDRTRRRCLSMLGVKRNYVINGLEIKIDFLHQLPDYQRAHRGYDRFLSELVVHLPSNSVVVDIGANVGDSLAGMAGKNHHLDYVCVEADRKFYKELTCNIELLKIQRPELKVQAVRELVGRDLTSVALDGRYGTKHALPGKGKLDAKPLAKILEGLGIEKSRLGLIKSDVDGFDWDVLRSAFDVLSPSSPMLFFECQFDSQEQFKNYEDLFRELFALQYSHFSFFDNYGNFVLHTESLRTVNHLLCYLRRMRLGRLTKTVGYFDVLVYREGRAKTVEEIVSAYLTSHELN